MDTTLRSSELGSAWAALKIIFPGDYKQLTRDMAKAVIQHQDWSGESQAFIQSHISDQVDLAKRAPAQQQVKYQKRKAEFLVYLSQKNANVCAYLGTGIGDPKSLSTLDGDQMKGYSDLIAATVEAIGAGRDSPATYSGMTSDDASKIKEVMISQGINDAEVKRALSGQVGRTSAENCRIGIIRNNALAAAPADIVAKVAFLWR